MTALPEISLLEMYLSINLLTFLKNYDAVSTIVVRQTKPNKLEMMHMCHAKQMNKISQNLEQLKVLLDLILGFSALFEIDVQQIAWLE